MGTSLSSGGPGTSALGRTLQTCPDSQLCPSATVVPKQQQDAGFGALQSGRSKGASVPRAQLARDGSAEPRVACFGRQRGPRIALAPTRLFSVCPQQEIISS